VGTTLLVGSLRSPGLGLGWGQTAQRVAEHMSPGEIDGIWLFPPVRREEREWGVAVVSRRADGERRRIYTASYMFIVRGRERGQGRVAVEEVGEGPKAVVSEVIRGVQERAGETEPPVEISPELWYDVPNIEESLGAGVLPSENDVDRGVDANQGNGSSPGD
jgi:hypothetical protein